MRIRSSNILYKKIWHNIEIHLFTILKIARHHKIRSIPIDQNQYIKLKQTEKELHTELEPSCKTYGNGTIDNDGSHGTWNGSIVDLMIHMVINSKWDIFVGLSIEWGGLHWTSLSTTWCIVGYRVEIPIRGSGALTLGASSCGCGRWHGVEGCIAFIFFLLKFCSWRFGSFLLLFPVCEKQNCLVAFTKWTTSKNHNTEKSFLQKPGKSKCHIQKVSELHTTDTDLFMQ